MTQKRARIANAALFTAGAVIGGVAAGQVADAVTYNTRLTGQTGFCDGQFVNWNTARQTTFNPKLYNV